MKKVLWVAVAFIMAETFAGALFPDAAHAYQVTGAGGAGTTTAIMPTFMPAMPTSSGSWAVGLQGAFQWFDSWLYGLAGFHILGFLIALLRIFSWLLGILKGAVDWLLAIL